MDTSTPTNNNNENSTTENTTTSRPHISPLQQEIIDAFRLLTLQRQRQVIRFIENDIENDRRKRDGREE